MAQATLGSLPPVPTSGVQLADLLVDQEAAQLSGHSGTSRPAYALPGTEWRHHVSPTSWVHKLFNGSADITLWTIDPAAQEVRFNQPAATTSLAGLMSAADKIILNSLAGTLLPIGLIGFWSAPTAPPGWLFCYGQAITNAANPALRAHLIAAGYPFGDDGTDPLAPDGRDRVLAGWGAMGGSPVGRLTGFNNGIIGADIGNTGGHEIHQLTDAQGPTHAHTQQGGHNTNVTGNHSHTAPIYSDRDDIRDGPDNMHSDVWRGGTSNSGSTDSAGDHAHQTNLSGLTTASGSSAAHNNVQPTLISPMIIYRGPVTA